MKNKKLIKLIMELTKDPEVRSITVNWTGTSPDMKPIIVITKK